IFISRALRKIEYPARFQLMAAMNPCPCGYLGEQRCQCTSEQIHRYRGKLSGPLLDRIDMHIEVHRQHSSILTNADNSQVETNEQVRARVLEARNRQNLRSGMCNARLSLAELKKYCKIDTEIENLLKLSMEKL